MAFIKKTWLARLGTGLNKFTVNGGNKVTLDSAPDSITQEGTPLSAQNMNDLEGRIETAFTGVDTALTGIDTDLTNLAGNFAQIETTPSTHNYSVGDMLVFNGILYKVITAIATNDALVVGSNIEAQTVASAIMNINSITYEWHSDSSWCIQFSSGFCLQGGKISLNGSDNYSVSLHKAYKNTDYLIFNQAVSKNTSIALDAIISTFSFDVTVISFKLRCAWMGVSSMGVIGSDMNCSWLTIGYV